MTSLNVTWRPDLKWPGVKIFTQDAQRINEQLCQIWRRCAPPFFCYPRKTDGGHICAPPGRARVKAPILTFDLTLTCHVTSFGKFRGCCMVVSSRALQCRVVRLSAAIHSRVTTWGRLTPPPPPVSRGWRNTPATAGLKGLSHLVQSCFSYQNCMSKDSARSTGHVGHFFPKKILRNLQEINV